MASLVDAEQLTQELERLVGEIRSEVNGDVDFEKLVSICDEMSERADAMAATFGTINSVLMGQIERVTRGEDSSRPSTAKGKARAGAGS
jgi:hypothetical protein